MSPRHTPLPAMLLALGAYSLFTVGDAIVRSMAGQWPGSAIAMIRYGAGAIITGSYVAIRLGRSGFALPAPHIQFGRGFSIAMMGILFWISLGYMPLADATTIQFTSPGWAVLLSALFLREAIGWRQMLLVLLAFGGTLIVLQPNLLAFGAAALLPLGTAIFVASLLMFNRMLGARGTVAGNQFWLALFATSVIVPLTIAGHFSGIEQLHVTMPSRSVMVKCLVLTATSTLGHVMLYKATLRASAAAVAPMTYVQMIVAVTLGWLAFNAPPTPAMLLGGAIIILAGWMLIRLNMRIARVVGETSTASK